MYSELGFDSPRSDAAERCHCLDQNMEKHLQPKEIEDPEEAMEADDA